MSRRLLIDQGNSFCKIAFSEGSDLQPVAFVKPDQAVTYLATRLHGASNIAVALYCCVGGHHEPLREWLKTHASRLIVLDEHTPIPIATNGYERASLGADRIAAAVGALSMFPDKDHFLVIDIGTAITFDWVDRKTGFRGGNISAGPGLRATGLHRHTALLPLVELDREEQYEGFAADTRSALANGLFLGVRYEIEGYIVAVRTTYPDAMVLLTGGYAPYFAEKIKNVTFVERLTMVGLNRIVAYNEEIEND